MQVKTSNVIESFPVLWQFFLGGNDFLINSSMPSKVRIAAEKAPEAVATCYEQTDIPKADSKIAIIAVRSDSRIWAAKTMDFEWFWWIFVLLQIQQ